MTQYIRQVEKVERNKHAIVQAKIELSKERREMKQKLITARKEIALLKRDLRSERADERLIKGMEELKEDLKAGEDLCLWQQVRIEELETVIEVAGSLRSFSSEISKALPPARESRWKSI